MFQKLISDLAKITGQAGTLNKIAISHFTQSASPRPHAYSLWCHTPSLSQPGDDASSVGEVVDYTAWPSLVNRCYSGRHLPPASAAEMNALPDLNDVLALYMRQEKMRKSRSSALFCFFAQWFTDSILRTDPLDRRKNTSNHEIDLCQIYGLTEETARILRSGKQGKLRCQLINGEVFPDYLYEPGADGKPEVKNIYKNLPYLKSLALFMTGVPVERQLKTYATGLERGNSSIGYVAISTLFLREHNRICDQLAATTQWDDERLFQTARMINIVLLMKVVIEDYINHIAGAPLFSLDPGLGFKEDWYRTNWIALEFNLLYRWHSLVPDYINAGDMEVVDVENDARNNNGLLEQWGLARALHTLSIVPAGKIGLHNVPAFLKNAEMAALRMARGFRLKSYNDYRVAFSMKRLKDFEELTRDPQLQKELRRLYATVDQVEFLPGLFAEDADQNALFGDLLNTMVGYDAFTQIYTNPLLAPEIYDEQTFTAYGFELFEQTSTVLDIAKRNVRGVRRAQFSFAN
ncbi:peroxidase family protein [Noviherbaspirillum sp. 1P10PC]|uniref:peroxidase family protein n=1 Tax=Noviherbaspirillum sp. 1P10PC TaxID=3132292 RepID=UPI0039A345EE